MTRWKGGHAAAAEMLTRRAGTAQKNGQPSHRKPILMTERKPVAFGDLRGWMKALDGAGEMHTINAEVDWNVELGTVARLAQGPGTGPALLFNNIRDYSENSRCRQVFTGALSSCRRIAMMLRLPPDTHPRELVKLGRTVLTGAIPPKIVDS